MQARVKALETVLTEKGLIDPAAIDAIVETYETKVGPRNGARVVARAWSDAGFADWLTQIEDAVGDRPYGVNLIVHRTNTRLTADLEVIVRHRVPVVITSLGAASEVVAAVHSYGGVVFHDVTTQHHARKAAEAGVDGLILVTAGAGGHASGSGGRTISAIVPMR